MSYLINPSITDEPTLTATFNSPARTSTAGPSFQSTSFTSTNVGGKGLIVLHITSGTVTATARTLTSMTVGGQSATIAIQKFQAGTSTGVVNAIAFVNYTGTSTTPTVAVTFSFAAMDYAVLGNYRILNNTNNTPIATASTGGTSTTTALTLNFSGLSSRNKVFIGASGNYVPRTNTWTSSFSMVERYDTSIGSQLNGSSASSTSTLTSGSITTTFNASMGTKGGALCGVVIE
jgi:hypothetical protein